MKSIVLTALVFGSSVSLGCQGMFIDSDEKPELAPVPGPPPAQAYAPPAPADEVQFDEPAPAGAMGEVQVIEPLEEDAPVKVAEPEPAPIRTYTIEKGDSYWKIAKKIYGDPMRMKDIEAANPDVNPKKLQVGDEIVLPE